MGWGIYSNWRQIKAIKKNIKKLYEQNLLQEQQIQDLAHYLNLTATRVQLHDKMYNIQVRLNRIDHSIGTLNDIVTFNWVSNNMLLDANVIVNRLITGLIVLRNNVERIYRYLNIIASQEVNPVMIPPPPLRQLLAEVQEEMKSNPRLMLPYDPQTEIYKFYEVMKITPVVVEDVLSMLLTIPLIDKSLQMNMYRAHNLPALHTKLGIAAEYILEGDYLAVDEHGLYVALPDAREIQICLTSQGGLCVMNQALHPVETVEWCVYALFIQDEQRIKRDCSMNFKPRKANVAQSMGGYLWAVSSLVGEKMQVRCLTETHVEVIKPPLQVIHIGNGCEGYSPSIKIPAKSELTSQNDIAERTTYFLDFNAQYEKSKDMGPWNLFELDKFTEKKLKGMVDMLPALPPMNYDNLNRRIGELDDYPLEIPVAIIAIVLVVSTVFLVATLVVYAYIIFRQHILPGQQAYPVQFEPLAHIRLSRSTYKVTTFIEFKPYISSFLRFQRFLELFLTDLIDPSRVSIYKHILGGHMTPQERTLITRVITKDKCSQTQEEVCSEETVKVNGKQILSQAECKKQFQLICRAVRQFRAITRAAEYIRRTFNKIKREFLSVIDHLETEAEEKDPRERRESNEKVQEELKIAYSKVSKEELEVLDDILKLVEEKYPDLNEKVLKRTKRFGVMSWKWDGEFTQIGDRLKP